jgi:acetylornithine deacetylase/succinyl-diaminopimelate desuccinylase-like protein
MTSNDLLKINVNDHVEKKNGLSYLSWAWAWAEALKADPEATFHVSTFNVDEVTQPFMQVGNTAMVWVAVTLFGKQRLCFLPVMDHRNKPIPAPDACQVNTAIMRCLVKCIALHGLGLYIYAGEDLPEEGGAENVPETKAEPKPEAKPVGKSREEAELFSESMLQYVTVVCKDEAGLKAYWKANQAQVDGLKSNHPDLFEGVKKVFTEMKTKFTKGEL